MHSATRSGATTRELCNFEARLKHRERVTRELDARADDEAPTADWIERLSGHVPVAPVFDVAQALDNPFVHGARRRASTTRTTTAARRA